MVAEQLDMSDQAALALACKDSLATIGYAKVLELRQPNQRKELLKLLFRLADDFPEHYLCSACTRFHLKGKGTNYKDYVPRALVIEDEHVIEYPQVLAAIEDETKTEEEALKWRGTTPVGGGWNMKWRTVKIKEGHLILRVLHSLYITTAIQTRPRLEFVPTCQHLRNPTTLIDACQELIDRTPRPWESSITLQGRHSKLFRCPYCPSEYCIGVNEVDDDHRRLAVKEGARYKLSINRCVDVGKAYSPHTELWAALTRTRPAGIQATVCYDLNGATTIFRRYARMAGQNELYNDVQSVLD